MLSLSAVVALFLASVVEVSWTLQTPRLVEPIQNVGCAKEPGDTYVVAFIFAGRRDRLRINLAYLDELIARCQLDEVHLWNHTINSKDDELFVNSTATKPGFKVLYPRRDVVKEAYAYYTNVPGDRLGPRFEPQWEGATTENTVIVKLDDDIVFTDVQHFACFTDFVRSSPDMFMVHANIVNNGVAGFYQAQYLSDVRDTLPQMNVYPFKVRQFANRSSSGAASDDAGIRWGKEGNLWSNGTEALLLHSLFTQAPEKFAAEQSASEVLVAGKCIKFGPPRLHTGFFGASNSHQGQGRFSINFFGARRAVWDEISETVAANLPHGISDEIALTVNATLRPGHVECIYVPLLVAHLSFYSQRPNADLALPLYERLLEKEQTVFGQKRTQDPAC